MQTARRTQGPTCLAHLRRVVQTEVMPRRTRPSDAAGVDGADELGERVRDKRSGWRADPAKGRRRHRRYTRQLTDWVAHHAEGEDALGGEASDS